MTVIFKMILVGTLCRFACILHGSGCFKSKERDKEKGKARWAETDNVKNQNFFCYLFLMLTGFLEKSTSTMERYW